MLFSTLFLLNACGVNYNQEMVGKYIPFNSKNIKIFGSLELELFSHGEFVYKKDGLSVLKGTWNAIEIREMSTIKFYVDTTIKSWQETEGSFNAPECTQFTIWHPKIFQLPNEEIIVFKKIN